MPAAWAHAVWHASHGGGHSHAFLPSGHLGLQMGSKKGGSCHLLAAAIFPHRPLPSDFALLPAAAVRPSLACKTSTLTGHLSKGRWGCAPVPPPDPRVHESARHAAMLAEDKASDVVACTAAAAESLPGTLEVRRAGHQSTAASRSSPGTTRGEANRACARGYVARLSLGLASLLSGSVAGTF